MYTLFLYYPKTWSNDITMRVSYIENKDYVATISKYTTTPS